MSFPTKDQEALLLERGRVWRYDIFSGDIAAAGTYNVGITTGAREVVIYNRKYSTTTPLCKIALHEVTFTDGTDPQFANRRLSSTKAPPATVKTGVAATVGAVIFSATLRAGTATGNAQVGFTDTQDAVILEANTSYVVQFTNLGASTAQIDMSFNIADTEKIFAHSEFGG